MIKNIIGISFIVLLLFHAGCTSYDPIRVDLVQRANDTENRLEIINGKYKFAPPDGIQVVISDSPDLSTTVTIRPDGNIFFPLLGDVYVEGLTPLEVRTKIHKLLKKYLRDLPEESVSIGVAGFNSKKVYVHNGVGPSMLEIPFTGENTVLDVIARSGALSVGAKQRKITVIRGDSDPDKKAERLVLNLKDITRKGMTEKNIVLRPNDIVYVPPTIFARLGMMFQSILAPVRSAEGIASTAYSVQTGGLEGFAVGNNQNGGSNSSRSR